ncbi:MAG: RluA family pseudouridine synthase [Treponema sp.]|nr:RluA family pseudouridine synthase [Candidatus Treponema merdequi]
MQFTDFFAKPDDETRRLDRVIRKMTPDSNISSLYSAIRKGLIKVNDKKADISYKVKQNDKISIASFLLQNNTVKIESENKQNTIQIKRISFDVVFQNEYVKIINKPYDTNVHGNNSLSETIESIYRDEKHDKSLSFMPGPCHRLDRKTTGLLCFSNSLSGAEWFTKNIADKTIRKFYIAVCLGNFKNQEEWSDYIIPDEENSTSFYKMKIDSTNCEEKNLARTICTPLAHGKYQKQDVTLCQFEILTGKKHQIRCQSAFHKIAILGDTAYGSIPLHEKQDFYLHAYRLIFPEDNCLKIPSELTAPLNKNFINFLSLSLINWDGSLIIK